MSGSQLKKHHHAYYTVVCPSRSDNMGKILTLPPDPSKYLERLLNQSSTLKELDSAFDGMPLLCYLIRLCGLVCKPSVEIDPAVMLWCVTNFWIDRAYVTKVAEASFRGSDCDNTVVALRRDLKAILDRLDISPT